MCDYVRMVRGSLAMETVRAASLCLSGGSCSDGCIPEYRGYVLPRIINLPLYRWFSGVSPLAI